MNNHLNPADYGTVILEGFRGSQAHGTYIPSKDPDSIDDIDYMGIYVMPVDHYLELDSYRHKVDIFIKNDTANGYVYINEYAGSYTRTNWNSA